jgi:hypothetical protein
VSRVTPPEKRRRATSAGPLPRVARDVLTSRGRPLEASAHEDMERRFGSRLPDVRIHTDQAASTAADALGAAAFTFGDHVAFGAGRYTPGSDRGTRLLAHELGHVLQRRGTEPTTPSIVAERQSVEEREADQGGIERPTRSTIVATAAADVVHRRSLLDEIGGLFAGEDFTTPVLVGYLDVLDRTNAIEDYTDSDNKARAVVRLWKRGDSQFILTQSRKILLIREMLSGFTGDDDERAILDLLRGSSVDERARVIAAVGEEALHSNLHGDEQDQLDALLVADRGRAPEPAARRRRTRTETLEPEMAADLQRRFTSNAESTNRLNCIEIIRDVAPRLYESDPELADRVRRRLARLRGQTLTMPDLGRAMAELGLASAYRRLKFDNGNGYNQPTTMQGSAWDTIMAMVGDVPGWHIFGLAVFDGYHSVTVMVDNRPDGPRLYWADQWRIDPGDDFHEEEGSVSGFRRYEQSGFDRFLAEYTESRWRDVFTKKGKRYDATLHIWKFRSSLSGGSQP